jgi:hypothetical protein
MKASATALAGALFLAGSALAAVHASAQEQVDMRSTLAGSHDGAYRTAEQGYAAPAPAYAAYPPVTARGRYGMRYSGYASAPVHGGYSRDAADYGDGRSAPRLVVQDGDAYGDGRDADYQSYAGGPLRADRRGEYSDGGDFRYADGDDNGGGDGGGYDRRYARQDRYDSYGGSDSGYPSEPYGYRGGRGYAGPYGYGYDRGEAEGVHYHYDGQVDRFSGFVAPPPHDSHEARELRDACGCDDEGY